MRTIRIKAYKFNELDEAAKQLIFDEMRERDYSFYFDEITESVKAVIELFNLKTGREYSDIRTGHIDDNILELSGLRLHKWLINNYWSDLFKGKYYGKLVKTYKDGTPIEISKLHPAGLRHVKRHSKVLFDNSGVLTGVCYDMDLLDPVYDFLKNPDKSTTFEDLIDDISNAIRKTYDTTEEWLNSEEFLTEEAENDNQEYTQYGKQI